MSGGKARAFSQLVAEGGNQDVVRINNTAASGDDRTLESYETLVIVDNDASYTQQIYLCPVSEGKGKLVVIEVPDTGGHVTVSDQDDSVDWTDQVSTADDDFLVLYGTGRRWAVLAKDMT